MTLFAWQIQSLRGRTRDGWCAHATPSSQVRARTTILPRRWQKLRAAGSDLDVAAQSSCRCHGYLLILVIFVSVAHLAAPQRSTCSCRIDLKNSSLKLVPAQGPRVGAPPDNRALLVNRV